MNDPMYPGDPSFLRFQSTIQVPTSVALSARPILGQTVELDVPDALELGVFTARETDLLDIYNDAKGG